MKESEREGEQTAGNGSNVIRQGVNMVETEQLLYCVWSRQVADQSQISQEGA